MYQDLKNEHIKVCNTTIPDTVSCSIGGSAFDFNQASSVGVQSGVQLATRFVGGSDFVLTYELMKETPVPAYGFAFTYVAEAPLDFISMADASFVCVLPDFSHSYFEAGKIISFSKGKVLIPSLPVPSGSQQFYGVCVRTANEGVFAASVRLHTRDFSSFQPRK